jgi:hypothetical protein
MAEKKKYPDELLKNIFETLTNYEFQPESKGILLHKYIEEEFSNLKREYEKDRSSKKFKYVYILDSYTLNSVQDFLNGCLTILEFPESLQVDRDLLLAVANFHSDFYLLLNENRPNFWYGWAVSNLILTFIENQKRRDRGRGIGTAYVYRLDFWKLMEELIDEGDYLRKE